MPQMQKENKKPEEAQLAQPLLDKPVAQPISGASIRHIPLSQIIPHKRDALRSLKPLPVVQDALGRAQPSLEQMRTVAMAQMEAAAPDWLQKQGLDAQKAMALPWPAEYAKRFGKKLQQPAEQVISRHWQQIAKDVHKLWTHRGQQFEYDGLLMWGPSRAVSLKDLTALVALTYLNAERSGLPAHFLQSIAGKETNFVHTADSDAGSGLTQFTAIGLAGVAERVESVNRKLQEWGRSPLDAHIGQAKAGKRWHWLVQEEKTVRVKVGRGKKARYKEKTLRSDVDFSQPVSGRFVRAPGFERHLADPVNAVELATALLIVKGASPGMSREQMRQAAQDYNGNRAQFTTPEGRQMSVRERYGREIVARTRWEQRP